MNEKAENRYALSHFKITSAGGKILALDYGASKIGAAVTDESKTIVFGRGFLSCKKGLVRCFAQIGNWCKEEEIGTIVIGLPFDAEGSETVQTLCARNFAKKLAHFLLKTGVKIQIRFEDESFSSFEADRHLSELGFKAGKSKQHQDELAAVLILQRYLKTQKLNSH